MSAIESAKVHPWSSAGSSYVFSIMRRVVDVTRNLMPRSFVILEFEDFSRDLWPLRFVFGLRWSCYCFRSYTSLEFISSYGNSKKCLLYCGDRPWVLPIYFYHWKVGSLPQGFNTVIMKISVTNFFLAREIQTSAEGIAKKNMASETFTQLENIWKMVN